MKPIKLWVKKLVETRPDFFRYKPQFWLLIEDYSEIQNESQLCSCIYSRCGEGRYMVLAYQKGVEGFWCFWLGNLYQNGYFRDINKNTYIERMEKQLQRELKEANSFEEKEEIEEQFKEDIEFEKEIHAEEQKGKRRGPIGIKALRPNILHDYNELPAVKER